MWRVFSVFLVVLVPILCLGDDGGVTAVVVTQPGVQLPDSPGMLVRILASAVQRRDSAMLAGGALMLVVWSLRSAQKTIPKKFLPLVGLFLSSATGMAAVLLVPGVAWEDVMGATISIWLMAVGSWAGVVEAFKKALSKDEPAAPVQAIPAPAPAAPDPGPAK